LAFSFRGGGGRRAVRHTVPKWVLLSKEQPMIRKIYHRPAPYTQRRRSPAYTLVSPDGTAYTHILDLHAFCLAHSLNFNQMYKLAKGEIEELQGWTKIR